MEAPSAEDYLRPRSLPDAVAALAAGPAVILGGGTDLYPAHVGRPMPRRILDVSAVAEMQGIAVTAAGIRIGGAATWTEIAHAPLPPAFTALQEAARQVGAIQVQNRGTIAGNLCNASPAADGIPPLLALGAELELASAAGLRRLPLASFVTGYRRTALEAGEVLVAVHLPAQGPGARSAFEKLGARRYLVISIVMVAALVRRDESGAIAGAAVAVGSASEKARRLDLLERDLAGCAKGARPSALLRPDHFGNLAPIGDVRATAAYRRDAAWQLVADALDRAAAGAP